MKKTNFLSGRIFGAGQNKQDTFYNEHVAEIILFESARKYLREHLGASKTLNISKWKLEVTALKERKRQPIFSNRRHTKRSGTS